MAAATRRVNGEALAGPWKGCVAPSVTASMVARSDPG